MDEETKNREIPDKWEELAGITRGPKVNYYSDEQKRQMNKDLTWRPFFDNLGCTMFNFGVPKATYEARMSLLSDSDRNTLEHAFNSGLRGRSFKYNYFGALPTTGFKIDWRETASLCVKATGNDAETAIRLFKASAVYDRSRDMEGKCVIDQDGKIFKNNVNEMYEKWIEKYADVAAINDRIYVNEKAAGVKHTFVEKLREKNRHPFDGKGKE